MMHLCSYDVTISNGVNLCDPEVKSNNGGSLGARASVHLCATQYALHFICC